MIDLKSSRWGAAGRAFLGGGMVLVMVACPPEVTDPIQVATCNLDPTLMFSSAAPNDVPALVDPVMVPIGDPDAAYLLDEDRVLGVVMNGEARAYPHNIMWYHEIVNDIIGGQRIAVTFAPFTGSGVGYETNLGGSQLDLGVSGLLFANNLIMFDRAGGEIYGPQLSIEGRCQGFLGQSLDLVPVQEMSWGRWQALQPSTTVVSRALPFGANYAIYPFGTYNDISDNQLVHRIAVDETRAIKERVLSIRSGDGGRGFPFLELQSQGDLVAINETVGGIPTAIFFEASDGQTALAFDARVGVGGTTLTFDADEVAGVFIDRETSSTWTINGVATSGAMDGEVMQTRADAFTMFWFAWKVFQPTGVVYAP